MTNKNDLISQKPLSVGMMLLFGLGLGIIAGLAAILFKGLVAFFHNLFFLGKLSFVYNYVFHTPESLWGVGVILVPVIGGLLVTLIIEKYSSEVKGNGVPEVMYAIHFKQGKIHPIVALLKALTAAISIGSGGSVGREGPMIQIGAALGSTLGQFMPMLAKQRILLIAAGSAAGISATFNTPLAGLLYSKRLIFSWCLNGASLRTVATAEVKQSRNGLKTLDCFSP